MLDLGCGYGRHVQALRERSVDVWGVDLSPDLLARGASGDGALRGRLVRADVRRLPFAAASFDAALSLFSSFGYFGDEGDGRHVDEALRVLRPGGLLVLDVAHPAHVRSALVARSTTVRDGWTVVERRRLAAAGRVVLKRVRLVASDGRRRAWGERLRLYEPDELVRLLATRGARLEAVCGGLDGRRLDPRAARIVVLARRGTAP